MEETCEHNSETWDGPFCTAKENKRRTPRHARASAVHHKSTKPARNRQDDATVTL